MLFAILCNDKPGSLQLRMDTRPEHLTHLNGLGDRLKLAGPFLNAEDKPCGSLVVVDVADEAEAIAVAEADPYAKAGLFADVTVRRWNWTMKNPDAA
ncbi:YciI-like protein [Aurantimonas sp. VKM B-3413]|uniref:YciI-like protein n=1 Tax=Aurantimonas sp. VKM B-3413 TaxID=2779401 RepID=UPI001E5EBCC1|nr:YciI-like protein [Aurantimonas sp. VKM B-3413]MCB8837732.1 YciI family protein [Aurantimonas sp. VKM B-3413]